MKRALFCGTILLLSMAATPADAAPSCKKYYRPGSKGEKLLGCKFRGGTRPTRQLGGKKYLTVVGTCYDYDVVVLQKCGCRKFERTSLCCGKGRSRKTCHWRVGKSRFVDCKKYKKPQYGLSGNKETPECRQRVNAASCFKKVRAQALVRPGPCEMVRVDCKGGKEKGRDFFNEKCGPLLSDCGCTIDTVCSEPKAVKCYEEWSQSKEGVACFWKQAKSMYDKKKCWEAVKAKGAK